MPDPIQKIELSRYAARVLGAHPEWAAELADPAPFTREEMAAALGGGNDAARGGDSDAARGAAEASFKQRLRHLRQRVLLRTMARDLAGRASLHEVCAAMSDLAELTIGAALEHAGCEDLAVIGMGKLGGRELNVSSDIDLVFVYAGDVEAHEGHERAGRRVIRLLADVTEDGFVFRVDMRLRPYGDSGPLACNTAFLENYFITQGREWERYAWIKARVLTGAPALRREIEATVRPFVFRKYLDYGTLEAMRRLHAEVRRDVERRELAGHVKLGPGGIREVEFVVQALQLIRGGRDAELTARPTLQVLEVLARKGILPESAKSELAEAYVFLRNVEHRLQYLDDAQRHDLPEDEEDRRRVAAMMGFAAWADFAARLQAVRAGVTRHFESVFSGPEAGARHDPWPAHPRAAAFRASQRYAALPEGSKNRVDALVPALWRAAAATPDPEATFSRGLDLVEAVATRSAYLALLAERPEALERVARMMSASSWAAEFVARHPLLLDELLDDRMLYAPPDLDFFARSLRAQLDAAQGDTESRMNALREAHQAQVFRLLAQDLAGLLTVERLADYLSALADQVLEAALGEAWADLPRKHREGTPRFAVVSYGKLGGKELGYASDLDIVFLFEDDDERAQEVYSRLAQRFITWLTSRTSAGPLFDTDLALRPSGASGLLVSSLEAFERYQERDAWVWEHQALTRARYTAGDKAIGQKFEAIRERILKQPRQMDELRKEILAMRQKLHAAHPNRSGLFDVKHDRGGMIDIEFAVQYLVLAFSGRHPDLTRNLGNIALLKMAGGFALIEPATAEKSADAYRNYRRIQHALRLNGAQYARVDPGAVAAEKLAVSELWDALFARTGA